MHMIRLHKNLTIRMLDNDAYVGDIVPKQDGDIMVECKAQTAIALPTAALVVLCLPFRYGAPTVGTASSVGLRAQLHGIAGQTTAAANNGKGKPEECPHSVVSSKWIPLTSSTLASGCMTVSSFVYPIA